MLSALVLSKQIHLKQASETVCTDGRVLDKIWKRVPDCGAFSVSIEPVTWYCKKLAVAGTQLAGSEC